MASKTKKLSSTVPDASALQLATESDFVFGQSYWVKDKFNSTSNELEEIQPTKSLAADAIKFSGFVSRGLAVVR